MVALLVWCWSWAIPLQLEASGSSDYIQTGKEGAAAIGGRFVRPSRIIDSVLTPEELGSLTERQRQDLEDIVRRARRTIYRQLIKRGEPSLGPSADWRIEVVNSEDTFEGLREEIYGRFKNILKSDSEGIQQRLRRKLDPQLAFFGNCRCSIEVRFLADVPDTGRQFRVNIRNTSDQGGNRSSVQMSAQEFEQEFGIAPPSR